MNERHHIQAWRLHTDAFTCMACRGRAVAVANVWCSVREWLVLFLCLSCLMKLERDTARLQGFLGEKRVRQKDVREFDEQRARAA